MHAVGEGVQGDSGFEEIALNESRRILGKMRADRDKTVAMRNQLLFKTHRLRVKPLGERILRSFEPTEKRKAHGKHYQNKHNGDKHIQSELCPHTPSRQTYG